MTPASKIFIVEDHPLMCHGLKQLLNQCEELSVCGSAPNRNAALEGIATSGPDLVIVDLSLEDGNGIELIKEIRARDDTTTILVMTMFDEMVYADRAFRAGAMGYIMKQEPVQEILKAVHCVLDGQVYMSARLKERMLYQHVKGESSVERSSTENLSDRELEIFELLGLGLKVGEIADRLSLSVKTVETYRTRIKKKMHISATNELVQFAIQWHRKQSTL